MYWVRTCQECGNRQAMKPPDGQMTNNWQNAKCRSCKSEALDYGSDGWIKLQDGNFAKPAEEDV